MSSDEQCTKQLGMKSFRCVDACFYTSMPCNITQYPGAYFLSTSYVKRQKSIFLYVVQTVLPHTVIAPFLRRNNQQTDDLPRYMPNGYSTLDNCHSKRIRRVPIFALTWQFFSDTGDPYVLTDVVTSHTRLDRETLHGQTSSDAQSS